MLKVFNTLTEKIEHFKPQENKKVEMYTCGPSVYRLPHIGNYRTFLFEDVLQRYLEYSGYKVIRLLTLTDVEDKAIAEAEKGKIPISKLTEENIAAFFADSELLRIKPSIYSPRSSTTVDQAAKLVKTLLEKGYAYWHRHEGRLNVYFDPLKFKDFGKLAHLNMSKWPKKKRRFHRDTYPGTPWNKGDFILWHGSKESDNVYWDTEIGKGRPAWNIQDAAMVTKHLELPVDIACGGIDNLVRHHDYTIAVAEGDLGKEFAHYWFHGEHLFVDGKKMSKSRGNVYYPKDLVKMGYRGEHIRFFLIYGHYRKRLNFTFEKIRETSQRLDEFKSIVNGLGKTRASKSAKEAQKLINNLLQVFEKNMNNDLDVKTAVDSLFNTISRLAILDRQGKLSAEDAQNTLADLRKLDSVLQVIF